MTTKIELSLTEEQAIDYLRDLWGSYFAFSLIQKNSENAKTADDIRTLVDNSLKASKFLAKEVVSRFLNGKVPGGVKQWRTKIQTDGGEVVVGLFDPPSETPQNLDASKPSRTKHPKAKKSSKPSKRR